MPPKEAYQKEKWLKNFIATKVSLNLENVDLMTMDWKGEAGTSFTNTIFTQAYKLMEAA
jgi:diketogulonate reductase-like aldo/keto reductase